MSLTDEAQAFVEENFQYSHLRRRPGGGWDIISEVIVGGVDDEGVYEVLLDDGPAQGERVYIYEHPEEFYD